MWGELPRVSFFLVQPSVCSDEPSLWGKGETFNNVITNTFSFIKESQGMWPFFALLFSYRWPLCPRYSCPPFSFYFFSLREHCVWNSLCVHSSDCPLLSHLARPDPAFRPSHFVFSARTYLYVPLNNISFSDGPGWSDCPSHYRARARGTHHFFPLNFSSLFTFEISFNYLSIWWI